MQLLSIEKQRIEGLKSHYLLLFNEKDYLKILFIDGFYQHLGEA